MKSCVSLLVGSIIGIIAFFCSSGFVRANEIFSDNFSNSSIDSHWNVNVNPGGTVNLQQNSLLYISSVSGLSSPYIYLQGVTIPNNNYRINIRFKLSGSYNYGGGIIFSTKLLQNLTPVSLREGDAIFHIWPGLSNIGISSSVCSQESLNCSDIQNSKVITSVGLDTWNSLEIYSDENNVYRLFLNGELIYTSKPSSLKISNIWFGNPERRTNNTKRPDIYIDYLNIYSPTTNTNRPTIIIPGLGASWNVGAIISGKDEGIWEIPTFINSYNGLKSSLVNAGYIENNSFFVFPYDWRRPLSILAERLNAFINEKIPPGEKVNLVGHSMGGLVARSYAQNFGVSRVNRIVTVGSPNMGVAEAYGVWEGATVWNDVWWAKLALDLTTHFGGLPNEQVQTLRNLAPSIKDLLPTYNYLKLGNTLLLSSTLNQRNDYLNNLNLNASPINYLTTAMFSNDLPTNSIINIMARSPEDISLNKWVDGKPIENPFETTSGDGTVIETSAKGPFLKTIQGRWWHNELVTSKENIQKIFGVLGLDVNKALEGIKDSQKNVFVAALRSPGKLEICNLQLTLCNSDLGGIYFPDNKLFILPGYNNENLIVRVKENNDQGKYELHLGNISGTSYWTVIDGDLNKDGQVDFYNIQSDGQNISAILETPPTISVNNSITNNNSPKLTGSVDDYAAVISINIAGKIFTADNNGDGTWKLADNIIVPFLADGIYNVTAKATDSVGKVGVDSTTNELTVDTITPTAAFKHYIDGTEFVGGIAYINKLNRLSFTGVYLDASPSSQLLKDSYVIFDEQNDGSFNFSQNGKKAYCSWRTKPNLVDLSGNIFSLFIKESFTKCIDDLNEGGYYMAHQVYDNAVRRDIPSITQFRDVLGLHFIIDKTPPVTTVSGIGSVWHKEPVTINFICTDSGRSGCNKTFYAINGGSISEGSSVTLSQEGQYTITYFSTDLAGNSETVRRTGIVKVDTTAPKSPRLFATDFGQRIWLSWLPVKTAFGYNIYYGSRSDQLTNRINTHSLYWVSNNLLPGKYFVTVTALDSAGNESVKSNVVQVKIDKKWWKW